MAPCQRNLEAAEIFEQARQLHGDARTAFRDGAGPSLRRNNLGLRPSRVITE